jgi:hypothetical protein
MTCWLVRRRLSAYVDRDLSAGDMRAVAAHLLSCPECERHHRSLRRTVEILGELPKLSATEPLATRVRDRLEVERRGPGLALVFRGFRAGRPLILPSLIPATFVVVVVLAGALLLDGLGQRPAFLFAPPSGEGRAADSGTEANPLFPTSDATAWGRKRVRPASSWRRWWPGTAPCLRSRSWMATPSARGPSSMPCARNASSPCV